MPRTPSLPALTTCLLRLVLCLSLSAWAPVWAQDESTNTDPGWPRNFCHDGNTIVVYQPQVDSWVNHASIQYWAALEVTPSGASGPSYGVVAIRADTLVDNSAGTVPMATSHRTSASPTRTPISWPC